MSRKAIAVLAVAIILGTWFRCSALDASGFAEDEIDIVRAVASYERGDFSANAEHPMLAKLAALASAHAGRAWGASPEQAIRLPSAIAGGVLTTLAIFLLCMELFPGRAVAPAAALLWALDVNAIAMNRTAKEDTFFVCFFVTAAWLYARAKRVGAQVPGTHWYTASGAAFGLMLACKYMPHFYGLHALYVRVTDPHPGANRPRRVPFHLAMAAAFFATNFAVLLPSSWSRLSQYLGGHTPIHTGYLFAHKLYVNSFTATPGGMPVTFYAMYLATKVPIVVLAAFAIGVIELVRRRTERGFVFARIFLVFVLLPYSLIGAKFVRYLLPLLAVIDIVAAAGLARVLEMRRRRTAVAWRLVTPALASLFVAALLANVAAARPFYGLAENELGLAMSSPGYLFTDDDVNDIGVREAVQTVAAIAGRGAAIASDASAVVEEYLRREGRSDMRSVSLSRDGLPAPSRETWIIAQDGHTYFENQLVLDQIQRQPSFREWRAAGVVTVRLFRAPAIPSAVPNP